MSLISWKKVISSSRCDTKPRFLDCAREVLRECRAAEEDGEPPPSQLRSAACYHSQIIRVRYQEVCDVVWCILVFLIGVSIIPARKLRRQSGCHGGCVPHMAINCQCILAAAGGQLTLQPNGENSASESKPRQARREPWISCLLQFSAPAGISSVGIR